MAHTRKDTLAKTRNWHDHMTKAEKRQTAKDERRAAKRLIEEETTPEPPKILDAGEEAWLDF